MNIKPLAIALAAISWIVCVPYLMAQQGPSQNPPGGGAPPASAGAPVAGDTADALGNVSGGNPVKTGCLASSTQPYVYTTNTIAQVHCDLSGSERVALFLNGFAVPGITDTADAVAPSASNSQAYRTVSRGTIFNGTTWDRQPGSAAAGTQSTPVPPTAVQTGGSSGVIANAAASASITATATRFSFISGFQITYDGATAGQCVNATLAGVMGGTRNYTVCSPTGVTLVAAPMVVNFNPPLSSTAINTQITLSVPALGAGNTNTAVNVDGYN